MNENFQQSKTYYWIKKLVASPQSFAVHLVIHLSFGILYSFHILDTNAILFIFGLISPTIFIVLNYKLIYNNPFLKEELHLPDWLFKKEVNNLIILIDSLIIIAFSLVIYFEIIDTLFLRLVTTFIIPFLLLIMIRVLFLIFPKD